jgi:hypothetical protein
VQQNGRGAVLLRAVANGSTLIPFGCDVTTDEQPRFIIADATNSTANDVTYTVTVYGIQEDTPGTPRASKLQSFPSEATGATTGFGTPPPVATSAVDAVQSA